jgi:DNA-binding transcriptional ArsR family regulator
MDHSEPAAAVERASGPDYEAPDTLVVSEREQLRALADDVRSEIVALLRERAFSTQQLAQRLGMPKGTVGHHVKVLEQAGLIRVVRTRKVRALTEKFYGRTAFLFFFQPEDPEDTRGIGASMLRQAAGALERSPDGAGWGHVKVKLTEKDRHRFERRLSRLMDDFLAADSEDGEPFGLAAVIYRRPDV